MSRYIAATVLLFAAAACGNSVDVEQERQAIRALWERGNRALEAGNWGEYSEFWAHTDYVQILHPDTPEWLVGWDEVGPNYRKLLAGEPAISGRTRDMRIQVSSAGEMAWATLKYEATFGKPPDTTTIRLWETAVFEKIEGEWKLVHGHASQPAELEE